MSYFRLLFILMLLMLAPQTYAEDASATTFSMATNAFLDTGALPVVYTCDGKDVSPDLSWSNPPKGTKSFAIVLSDPDASGGTFYHWVLFNLPADTKALGQGATPLPAGAALGNNSFNKTQYNGPCPPKGSVHTYVLSLYALDSKLNLQKGVDPKTFMTNMKDHILQKVQFTMVYSRWLT